MEYSGVGHSHQWICRCAKPSAAQCWHVITQVSRTINDFEYTSTALASFKMADEIQRNAAVLNTTVASFGHNTLLYDSYSRFRLNGSNLRGIQHIKEIQFKQCIQCVNDMDNDVSNLYVALYSQLKSQFPIVAYTYIYTYRCVCIYLY